MYKSKFRNNKQGKKNLRGTLGIIYESEHILDYRRNFLMEIISTIPSPLFSIIEENIFAIREQILPLIKFH